MSTLFYIVFACCMTSIICTIVSYKYDDAIELLLDVKHDNKVKLFILSISVIILISLTFIKWQ
jgi:hypothetical protein